MKVRSSIAAIAIIASAPVDAQESVDGNPVMLTDEQRDAICHSFADFGAAIVDAREAGVPIDQVLEFIRTMPSDFMPSEEAAQWFRNLARQGVVQAYAEIPVGRRPTELEQRQLINRWTADCILEAEKENNNPE